MADATTATKAAMLLMQEVICEKIYREVTRMGRGNFDFQHPNKAMGIRTITPDDLRPHIALEVLTMPKEELRKYAAEVLDAISAG